MKLIIFVRLFEKGNTLESGPIIVQGDRTILLEVKHPRFVEARDTLAAFAELVKSPEHIHSYQITPLSLWNAASAGHSVDEVIDNLQKLSRYPVPSHVLEETRDMMARYGKLSIIRDEAGLLWLQSADLPLFVEISRHPKIIPYFLGPPQDLKIQINPIGRGSLKNELIKLGFPAEDVAGYITGTSLPIQVRTSTLTGKKFGLRHYQQDAVNTFFAGGTSQGGSGVIVLPCGAGKTVVAMGVMSQYQCHTLIITTNVVAARQWISEILDKTTLTQDQVGEYNGSNKDIRPVTVATYQILTYRKRQSNEFPHFEVFSQNSWGLIVYDEVHLLPAPIFKIAADMQATRRLGLTATLIREDNKETDVFALIGPKKFDVPWKILEKEGWIATARCTEIKVPLPASEKMAYAVAANRDKINLAACNPKKDVLVQLLLNKHKADQVLIIGQYLDQLHKLSTALNIPLMTGATGNPERIELFRKFRNSEIKALIVSKVGNFAIDLPDANILIQVSGTFGSRQEEAQRLGRILRPKEDGRLAEFYTLVTKDTREQDFAMNRQLYLAEQGYHYQVYTYSPETAAEIGL